MGTATFYSMHEPRLPTPITRKHGFLSEASLLPRRKISIQAMASRRFGSSLILPVTGNVYPLGYYSVSLDIGNPPKSYDFDIDTGSDLTWVQCDAPCAGCTVPVDRQYKPCNNIVLRGDPLCRAIFTNETCHCESPDDQCDYEVEYADNGSSVGVLVMDYFHLHLMNGSLVRPHIAFGCGYDQRFSPTHPLPTAGVLGLGSGKGSIVSQLCALGLTQNVVGHCFSTKGGGYLFFGRDLVPSSRVTWMSMSGNPSLKNQYSFGPAELLFDGKSTGIDGLKLILDSGSSYTYFSHPVYRRILDLIKNGLKGMSIQDAKEEKALPVCWRGPKPFKSIHEAKTFFKPLALSFIGGNHVQLQIPPERYLIITERGNVCLGILDGSKHGLGDLNIIGDISLQDIMVIYDNERRRIGWLPTDCWEYPKS